MNDIKIQCKKSIIAEALGLLSAISTYGVERFDNLDEMMSPLHYESLEFWKQYPFKGMELGNLLLAIDPYLRIEDFFTTIKDMETLEFQYYIYSEAIPRDVILKSKSDFSVMESFVETSEYLSTPQLTVIRKIIEESEQVKVYVRESIQLSYDWLQKYGRNEDDSIKKFMADSSEMLRRIAPLEYAQQLMGKKFKRLSDYTAYHFIPTYYSGLNCIRFFDETKLIVLDRVGPSWDAVTSESIAKVLKVLSDGKRLEIMSFIADRPSYGIELSERFGVSRPTISHHIEQMNSVGLLHMERVKNTKYYSLNKRRYKELIKELNDYVL